MRGRQLLDDLLADLDAGRPDVEVAAALAAMPREDLLRARKLIDQYLTPHAPPSPLDVIDGGMPFRDWLADEVDHDYHLARRLLTFIDEYGASAASRGSRPTIPQLAADTEQSVATVNRRLSEFRRVFPSERDPLRLVQALRRGLDDSTVWTSCDDKFAATIGDVPVVARQSRAVGR